MPSLNTAYNYVIEKCNAPDVGYSQAYRRGQWYNGAYRWDCSSLMCDALYQGGFYSVNPWWSTHSERNALKSLGFYEYAAGAIAWEPGDIMWRAGHTEMVYVGAGGASGRTMGAHTDTVPLADQVSINNNVSNASSWTYLYRYPGGVNPPAGLSWIKGNRYLSQQEQDNNAQIIATWCIQRGWSKNAICGMLGNMSQESTVNPGCWQSLIVGSGGGGGYGLVQWTPWTNYTNWADANNHAWDDGNAQLEWIDTQTVPFGQWIATSAYPISFAEFKVSNNSVEWLVYAFLKNFERAGVEAVTNRINAANRWAGMLDFSGSGGVDPDPPEPPPVYIPERGKGLPFYMQAWYNKIKNR